MVLFLAALVIAAGTVSSASAQITTYRATTENHDTTWNRSTRVTHTRVQASGRTIETQIVEKPSVNGGYALETATETETIPDGPDTIHVVERWYVPDGNGRRQLARIIESETTTAPGKSTTTIRTRYDSDLDGHLQAMERDTEESIRLNASATQMKSTLFLLRGNMFVPIQQTVTVETRKDNGAIDVQRTVSLPDHYGKFIPTQVTHTVEVQTGSSRTKEERTLRADSSKAPGEGQLLPVERTVTQEWRSPDGEDHSLSETSSMFTIGVASDGQLHMNRQIASMRRVADGVMEVVQQTAEINPGAKTDRPRVIEKKTESSRRGATGQFETSAVIEAPSSSGAMQPFWRSKTRGFSRGSD